MLDFNRNREMNKCKECRWWDQMVATLGSPMQIPKFCYGDDMSTVNGGRCRRYAPKGEFPFTREDDWCGEFELRN